MRGTNESFFFFLLLLLVMLFPGYAAGEGDSGLSLEKIFITICLIVGAIVGIVLTVTKNEDEKKTGRFSTAPRVILILVSVIIGLMLVYGFILLMDSSPDINPKNINPVELNRKLIKIAEKTRQKLQTTPASWRVVVNLGSSWDIHVDMAVKGDKKRVEITTGLNRLCRIIMKDDLWYVEDIDKSHKIYRPYEAPLRLISAYLFFRISELQFLDFEVPGLKVSGLKNNIVTLNVPIPEEMKSRLENVVGQLKGKKAQQQMSRLKTTLQEGNQLGVHMKYGFYAARRHQDFNFQVENFQWRDDMTDETFSTSGNHWENCSDSMLEGDLNDLVMISYNPMLKYGDTNRDVEANLMNVKSGQYRRIPFKYGRAIFGCFSRDRKKVYSSGFDFAHFKLDIFEVDLVTGENRNLTEGLLAQGIILAPVLSPDGTKLVFLYKDFSGPILSSQLYLMDLNTGDLTTIGEPSDFFNYNWLPGGKGLIYRRILHDGSKYGKHMIYRIDLDGNTSFIINGDSPLLLDNGRRILFENDDLWYTCDIDGKDVQLYADGMKKHFFPALSPDGTRILWMQFLPGRFPLPRVYKIGIKEGTTITSAPGLWANPVWK